MFSICNNTTLLAACLKGCLFGLYMGTPFGLFEPSLGCESKEGSLHQSNTEGTRFGLREGMSGTRGSRFVESNKELFGVPGSRNGFLVCARPIPRTPR
jgi:hypothetical protein